jgi:hypothetical protein
MASGGTNITDELLECRLGGRLQFVACYIVVGPTECAAICLRNGLDTRVCVSPLSSDEIAVFCGV